MGYLACTLYLGVVGIFFFGLCQGQDASIIRSHKIKTEIPVENEQGEGSCPWKKHTQNGHYFRPCLMGQCTESVGIHMSNGTSRFTSCDRHHVLVGGDGQDICVNGQWTTNGHKCISCGRSQNTFDPFEITPRIQQGNTASLGDFPWMAALYALDAGEWEHSCGATLISPRLLLTAASCLNVYGKQLKPEDLRVGLGKLLRNINHHEEFSVISSVKEVVIPERYQGATQMFAMDIALLVLQEDVATGPYIMPACMDWDHTMELKHNETGYLAGWGITEQDRPSDVLKWTSLKQLEYEQCRDVVPVRIMKFVTQDKICIAPVKGGNADKGDGGGGLTILRDGVHYVYGVASIKFSDEEHLNVRLFTDVLNDIHIAWLWKHWRRIHHNQQKTIETTAGNAPTSAPPS